VTDNLEQTITNILKNIKYTRSTIDGNRKHYIIGAKKEAAGDLSSLKWPINNEGFTLWNGVTMQCGTSPWWTGYSYIAGRNCVIIVENSSGKLNFD
jgi:hypothetical protein